jgi:preprotein translocase subunit SecA
MLKGVLKTVFGDPHQKEIKTLTPLVEEVNALADEMKSKSGG